jgi:hypothetical protein
MTPATTIPPTEAAPAGVLDQDEPAEAAAERRRAPSALLWAFEHQGDEIAVLAERIASLEEDVVRYREVAHQAIHALHHITRERDRLSHENVRLRDQVRTRRAA